jgi:hypothetical protein
MTAEQRVAALWERLDDTPDEDFRRRPGLGRARARGARAASAARSLSMNGGAQVPAGGGEVSMWCHGQAASAVAHAQMMMLQVGGFS